MFCSLICATSDLASSKASAEKTYFSVFVRPQAGQTLCCALTVSRHKWGGRHNPTFAYDFVMLVTLTLLPKTAPRFGGKCFSRGRQLFIFEPRCRINMGSAPFVRVSVNSRRDNFVIQTWLRAVPQSGTAGLKNQSLAQFLLFCWACRMGRT